MSAWAFRCSLTQGFLACTPRVLSWVLGFFLETLGDYVGSYKGHIRAILGNRLGVRPLGDNPRTLD